MNEFQKCPRRFAISIFPAPTCAVYLAGMCLYDGPEKSIVPSPLSQLPHDQMNGSRVLIVHCVGFRS
jgi:hypothetical protein